MGEYHKNRFSSNIAGKLKRTYKDYLVKDKPITTQYVNILMRKVSVEKYNDGQFNFDDFLDKLYTGKLLPHLIKDGYVSAAILNKNKQNEPIETKPYIPTPISQLKPRPIETTDLDGDIESDMEAYSNWLIRNQYWLDENIKQDYFTQLNEDLNNAYSMIKDRQI